MKSVFITATDTEVGKTTIAAGILAELVKLNKTAAGFKPIAAGCELIDGQLKNEDALTLMKAANHALDYNLVNPFALKTPIAPHIAAQQHNIRIDFAALNLHYNVVKNTGAERIVVEGAGGWQLPLNETDYLSQWVVAQNLPVVLVVGLKLGCINHALLTAMAIKQMGGQLIGWVANHVDPNMLCQQENIQALTERLPAHCLGVVPHLSAGESAGEYLNISLLEQLL
ncbi:dethiobiotin synthase [Catenovulum sp. 2E275]|uniref:dethiobiotin synthase n=1 Tax=Catenovulum sp. 2E275 TaxID=2980497 RepID=UPI0021CF3A65|nr:dethiobiotin synthase [Catenovulum sp. 2E275]MCU4674471.1 dethiobiotin synthase [Catenovulum sp. 2E275]